MGSEGELAGPEARFGGASTVAHRAIPARSSNAFVKWLSTGLVWGIRIPFCLLLPAAIVPTEWYLLDLGNAALQNLPGMLWALAIYALVPIGFVGGLGTLAWQLLRGLLTLRFPSVLGVFSSLLALTPAPLLVGCKLLDVDEYGFLARHEEDLLDFVENSGENDLGYKVFWQDDDFVVVEVHFGWQLAHVTGFAYSRSAADAVRTSGGAFGAGAAESDAAVERLRAEKPYYSITGSHLRGPWSMVTVHH